MAHLAVADRGPRDPAPEAVGTGEQGADRHVAAVAAAGDRHATPIQDAAIRQLVDGGELVVDLDPAQGAIERGLERHATVERPAIVHDDDRAAELRHELAP